MSICLDAEYFNDGKEIRVSVRGGAFTLPRSMSPVRVEWTPQTKPSQPGDRLRTWFLPDETRFGWNPTTKVLEIGDVADWHARRSKGAAA